MVDEQARTVPHHYCVERECVRVRDADSVKVDSVVRCRVLVRIQERIERGFTCTVR